MPWIDANNVDQFINALQEFAGYDYAKLLQWYDRECKKAWERNCVTMTFTLYISLAEL